MAVEFRSKHRVRTLGISINHHSLFPTEKLHTSRKVEVPINASSVGGGGGGGGGHKQSTTNLRRLTEQTTVAPEKSKAKQSSRERERDTHIEREREKRGFLLPLEARARLSQG